MGVIVHILIGKERWETKVFGISIFGAIVIGALILLVRLPV
jgi:hypothetical protein